jgi:hypothetical protein
MWMTIKIAFDNYMCVLTSIHVVLNCLTFDGMQFFYIHKQFMQKLQLVDELHTTNKIVETCKLMMTLWKCKEKRKQKKCLGFTHN